MVKVLHLLNGQENKSIILAKVNLIRWMPNTPRQVKMALGLRQKSRQVINNPKQYEYRPTPPK